MATILLAEDDGTMRRFLERALAKAGHDVIAVADGRAAMDALAAAHYDLLLADIVMPGIDGIELARLGRRIHPDLPIMFITGFAAVALRARSAFENDAKVLSKPFHLRELVDEVEKLLDGGARKRTGPPSA